MSRKAEQAALVFNIFVCLEMIEDFYRAAKRLETQDMQLHKSFKQSINMILENYGSIKRFVRQAGTDSQISYGMTADMIREVMFQLYEATYDNPDESVSDKVLDFMESLNKKVKLNRKLIQ